MNSSSASRERTKRAQGLSRPEVVPQAGKAVISADPLAKSSISRSKRASRSLVVDAEDGAHDHRQGDPLGVGAQREGLADRPALHLAARHLDDQLAVAPHPLAVEGRQQQLALLHVRRVVEGEDRVGPERRLQHRRVRLAGVEDCSGGPVKTSLTRLGSAT